MIFLHGCEMKSGCGRLGNEATKFKWLSASSTHLLPQELALPELAQEHGDEEGPETQDGAPEGRVRLVADAKSPRQRPIFFILLHEVRFSQVLEELA